VAEGSSIAAEVKPAATGISQEELDAMCHGESEELSTGDEEDYFESKFDTESTFGGPGSAKSSTKKEPELWPGQRSRSNSPTASRPKSPKGGA
jgi:hypothetical protein